jgi:tetratricopeptide (TPR) repeat protein
MNQSTDLDEATRCVTSDPERSLGICDNFLQVNPDDRRGLFCRFQAWDALCEYENALSDINRVIEKSPDFASYFSRGMFLHKFGHYERAVADLTKARELDVDGLARSTIALYRADSLARLGRLDDALADGALVADDHWMPALCGIPEGNKQDFIAELRRRAEAAPKS